MTRPQEPSCLRVGPLVPHRYDASTILLKEGDGQAFFRRSRETPPETASVTTIVTSWQAEPGVEVCVQTRRRFTGTVASALTVPRWLAL